MRIKLDKLFKVLVTGGVFLSGSSCTTIVIVPGPDGAPNADLSIDDASDDLQSLPDQSLVDWTPPPIDAVDDASDCRCTGASQESCYCNGNMCCWLVNDPCCSTCHPHPG